MTFHVNLEKNLKRNPLSSENQNPVTEALPGENVETSGVVGINKEWERITLHWDKLQIIDCLEKIEGNWRKWYIYVCVCVKLTDKWKARVCFQYMV